MSHRVVSRGLMLALATVLCVSCGRDAEVVTREHVAKGDAHVAEKRYAEAIIEYRNAIKRDSRFGEARHKLAAAYAASGDLRHAAQEAVRAADLLLTNIAVQLEAVRYLLASSRFEEAESRARRILDFDTQNVDAHVLRGSALVGLRDIDGAVQQLEEALKLDPDQAVTHTRLAGLRLAAGRQDDARVSFERAVQLDPHSVPALVGLAIFHWAVGEITAAERALQRVVLTDPRHVPGHRALAALYIATARAPEAEPHVRAIAELTDTPETRFALADYYVLMKRFRRAGDILESMKAQPSTFAGAQGRLAQLAYHLGQPSYASALLDELLRRDTKNASALLLKAQWLLREGKPGNALAHASEVVKAHPGSVRGHYLLGLIHLATRDRDAAAQAFREVLRLNPNAVAAQLQLSRLELLRGGTDEAIQLAQAALKSAQRNPEARLTMAAALIARQDLSRARVEVKALLRDYPDVAAVHAAHGALSLAAGDVILARRSLARALELDPGSVDALSGLTAVDIRENKLSEARARVERALAAQPNHVSVLLVAARVFMTAGDVEAAERTLRRALELAPADTTIYELLARAYVAQGKLGSAKAEFDEIARRRPRDTASRTMAAIIAYTLHDVADAMKRYEAVLEIDPGAAIAANNLAWLHLEARRDLDHALRLAKIAVAAMPDNSQAHDTLGWIYYRKELPLLAIPALERSVALAPDNGSHLYHLAFAYLKSGQKTKAHPLITRALMLQPDGDDANEARSAIQSLDR